MFKKQKFYSILFIILPAWDFFLILWYNLDLKALLLISHCTQDKDLLYGRPWKPRP